jgi:hypothetical protein
MSKKHKKYRQERPVQTPEEQQEAIDHLFKAIEAEHPVQEQEPTQEPEPVVELKEETKLDLRPKVKTTSMVNFRSSPDRSAPIIFAAPKDTTFYLISQGVEWSQLEFTDGEKGVVGYIMSSFLKEE